MWVEIIFDKHEKKATEKFNSNPSVWQQYNNFKTNSV